jgi:hypothetical protein
MGGGVNEPAGTTSAFVIVVSGSESDARLSQVAASAGAELKKKLARSAAEKTKATR